MTFTSFLSFVGVLMGLFLFAFSFFRSCIRKDLFVMIIPSHYR